MLAIFGAKLGIVAMVSLILEEFLAGYEQLGQLEGDVFIEEIEWAMLASPHKNQSVEMVMFEKPEVL